MLQIQKIALQKAIQTLKALNCQYAIIDDDGEKYGELNVAASTKNKKRPSLFPFGELSGYISSKLDGIKVGDVKEVPYGKYGGATVQGSSSAYMHKNFGSGSHTSTQNHVKQVVEVLRLS